MRGSAQTKRGCGKGYIFTASFFVISKQAGPACLQAHMASVFRFLRAAVWRLFLDFCKLLYGVCRQDHITVLF